MNERKKKINVLSEATVSKISAGEVVERPASVIKELIENSLDASSKNIHIDINSAGKSLIRVSDDGIGMSREDLEIACSRHTTSKISSAEDLDAIRTLGFRGEALSSIAAVSQMDITSSSGVSETGTYVYVESGEILRIRPAGRSEGTTVEVRNLFYNVPARKKFLKKDSSELAEIVRVVGRFVLAYADVGFELKHGERQLLHVPGNLSMLERIELILGKNVAESLEKMVEHKGKIGIRGYISRPSATQKDKRAQLFYINGRYVRNRALSSALYAAYKSMLEKNRHPACILFLEISPDMVDVNVHPTKLQVKFREEQELKKEFIEALKRSFENLKKEQLRGKHLKVSSQKEDSEFLVFSEGASQQDQFTYEYDRGQGALRTSSEKDRNSLSSDGQLGQLHQIADCYILSVFSDKVIITDQHAAHERINYELFSKAKDNRSLETQNLIFPARIELSAEDSIVLTRLLEGLKKLGFFIEPFGERSFIVQSVPATLKKGNVEAVIYDILSDIKERDLEKVDIIEELIKITSCKAAIKSGTPLSVKEMEVLLEELSRCELPFTCPHGRPVSFEMDKDILEKRFRRK